MSNIDTKLKCIFLFFLSLVILFLSSCFFLSTKGELKLNVKSGFGISNVSNILKSNGIISSSFIFKSYFYTWRILNKCDKIHIGEYIIKNKSNFSNIYNDLCSGNSLLYSITIPEGLESREIIEILNNNPYLSGDKIGFINEGVLLPETYNFKSGTSRVSILEKMNRDLFDFLNYEWSNRECGNLIRTKKDALILASIVEKEAKTDEERPIIASVYLNRLKKNMKLEADPTAIYEITKGKYKMSRLLNKKDLKINGKYNTYRKFGLPIEPICNAGKNSILAVLHPANTDYFYFVAKKDLSGHIFSKNYKEHLTNIKIVKSRNQNT